MSDFLSRKAFWDKWRKYLKPFMWLFIPFGTCYCYSISRNKGRCPWWDSDPTKGEQSRGYCHYSGESDADDGPVFLLWDQVKECCGKDPDWYNELRWRIEEYRHRHKKSHR